MQGACLARLFPWIPGMRANIRGQETLWPTTTEATEPSFAPGLIHAVIAASVIRDRRVSSHTQ